MAGGMHQTKAAVPNSSTAVMACRIVCSHGLRFSGRNEIRIVGASGKRRNFG
jgi:hypothetical protein